MTESTSTPTSKNNQLPVHAFHDGVLTNTLPAFDDWSAIEADLARLTWEDLLKHLPNQGADFPDTFSWR